MVAVAAAGGVTGTTAVGGLTPGDGATVAEIVGGTTALASTVEWFMNGAFFASLDLSASRNVIRSTRNHPAAIVIVIAYIYIYIYIFIRSKRAASKKTNDKSNNKQTLTKQTDLSLCGFYRASAH